MPYTDHPVWSFPPNWAGGVLETLEWKTEVLSSENGEEQRISRRLTPRRSFEASFLIQQQDRQLFANLLLTKQAIEWVVPIWHDISRTTAASAAGSDRVHVDTTYREYVAGRFVYLRGPNARKWEVVEIESVDATGLQLISNLEKSWPKGTRVYPAAIMTLESAVNVTKRTDEFFDLSTRFTVVGQNKHPRAGYFLEKFEQVPVCEPQPDEHVEITANYRRLLATFDSETSQPSVYDMTSRAQQSYSYRWSYVGRVKHTYLRDLLYHLRGRFKALWLPTFTADLTPVTPPTGEVAGLTIHNVGYHRNNLKDNGYSAVRILMSSGVKSYRRIVATAEVDEDTETVLFDSPTYVPDGVRILQISYMMQARMETDTVELNHNTDADGVTTVGVIFSGPYEASQIHDPTSKPYTVIGADGVRLSVGFEYGGIIERSIENLTAIIAPGDGTLTTTYFPHPHTQQREEFTALIAPSDGTLTTTYFPHYHTQTVENITATIWAADGTLTRVYFPVNYTNWPAEGVIVGQVSIVQASVT